MPGEGVSVGEDEPNTRGRRWGGCRKEPPVMMTLFVNGGFSNDTFPSTGLGEGLKNKISVLAEAYAVLSLDSICGVGDAVWLGQSLSPLRNRQFPLNGRVHRDAKCAS